MYPPNTIQILEEADNRIVWHIKEMLKCGKSKISVKTKDSDVMVILLGFMTQFLEISKDAEIFADYNSGNARQFISIKSAIRNGVGISAWC